MTIEEARSVVWANPSSAFAVKNPTIAVWSLKHLSDELGNVWLERGMEQAVQARIVEKLTSLCRPGAKKAE